jgi:DNA mismatch repair protein MutH
MMLPHAPQTESELMQRAENLCGMKLGTLAQNLAITSPVDLRSEKGWVGQLLEIALGATAQSKAEPDFQALQIELKTIPLNAKQQAKESTFVCTVPKISPTAFHDSIVYRKLRRVLWFPIEADNNIPLAERRVGIPLLWSPNIEEEKMLAQDWTELTEMLALGYYEKLSAKYGTYLHIRPKAAHSKIHRADLDPEGNLQMIIPRGFYLRTQFTNRVLGLIHLPLQDGVVTS